MASNGVDAAKRSVLGGRDCEIPCRPQAYHTVASALQHRWGRCRVSFARLMLLRKGMRRKILQCSRATATTTSKEMSDAYAYYLGSDRFRPMGCL
jgi:hypothetical protein